MHKNYLIDGYNLIHASADLSRMAASFGMDRARMELISQLASFADRRNCQVTVVFDGTVNDGGAGRVRVLSSRTRTADAIIREQASSMGRGVVVVSSDLEIVGTARTNLSTVIKSSQFARELGTANTYDRSAGARPHRVDELFERSEKPRSVDDDDIEEWKKLFGA